MKASVCERPKSFKSHNCRVIDTGKAMVLSNDGKTLVVRSGGMPQRRVTRKGFNAQWL